MPHPPLFLLIAVGLVAGVLSGVFGIGGGVVIVPSLIYFVGFSQHLAIGTSLAVLLPPIGIAAVMEYYRHGHVNLYAALVIAVTVAAGGWVGAVIANHIVAPYLRLAFAVFVLALGVYLVVGAVRQLGGP
ncbi:MAG: TSUP family transporter [Vicinamibacterales bacterium]